MDEHREMKVTPDRYLTYRYAGASGDFNPIHIDPEFAKQVGLPSNILHGLWTMAQVARANVNAAGGDPRSLKRLSVQFRGMGLPEQEITVSGTVSSPFTGCGTWPTTRPARPRCARGGSAAPAPCAWR
jgi:acyl dehydratase